jgi:hypothetical protein
MKGDRLVTSYPGGKAHVATFENLDLPLPEKPWRVVPWCGRTLKQVQEAPDVAIVCEQCALRGGPPGGIWDLTALEWRMRRG